MGKKEAIAQVYAEALVELAFEKGIHAEVLAELREVGRLFREDPRAETFFVAPHIPREAKKKMIDAVFGSRFSETVSNFLKVLVDKGRQASLFEIVERFEEDYRDRTNEILVKVTTAVPLDDGERERFKQALRVRTGREPVLDERVDATVVGGVIVRIGDTVVDGSLKKLLGELALRLAATRVPAGVVAEG